MVELCPPTPHSAHPPLLSSPFAPCWRKPSSEVTGPTRGWEPGRQIALAASFPGHCSTSGTLASQAYTIQVQHALSHPHGTCAYLRLKSIQHNCMHFLEDVVVDYTWHLSNILPSTHTCCSMPGQHFQLLHIPSDCHCFKLTYVIQFCGAPIGYGVIQWHSGPFSVPVVTVFFCISHCSGAGLSQRTPSKTAEKRKHPYFSPGGLCVYVCAVYKYLLCCLDSRPWNFPATLEMSLYATGGSWGECRLSTEACS